MRVSAGEDEDAVNDVVTLELTASRGGYDGVSEEVTVTVIDNDEPYSLQIADAEASESAGEVVFAVTLSGQSASEVTVDFATSDGTAEAGTDYSASSGTLSIPAGSTTAQIRVPILDDAEDESDETFSVQLSAPTGASLEDAVATGTILDDDGTASLTVTDAEVLEKRRDRQGARAAEVPSPIRQSPSVMRHRMARRRPGRTTQHAQVRSRFLRAMRKSSSK